MIEIIQPTRCNSFKSLLFDVYVWLNMFRVSPRPSSGAYNCTRSIWFYRWREAAGALLVVVLQVLKNLAHTGVSNPEPPSPQRIATPITLILQQFQFQLKLYKIKRCVKIYSTFLRLDITNRVLKDKVYELKIHKQQQRKFTPIVGSACVF